MKLKFYFKSFIFIKNKKKVNSKAVIINCFLSFLFMRIGFMEMKEKTNYFNFFSLKFI